MTLLKTPFAAVRTRRLRQRLERDLDNRLLRDIGLPERQTPAVDITALLFMRFNQ